MAGKTKRNIKGKEFFTRNRVHPPTTDTPGMGHGSGTKKSTEKVTAFLAVLATATGTVSKACRAIGIDRRTAYNWKEDDEEFSKAWDAAIEESIDALEGEARRRGFEGVDKPVYFQGDRIDTVKEYSDTMLSLVLKGRRANVFRDKVEHSGPEGGAIQHEVTVKFVRAGEKK